MTDGRVSVMYDKQRLAEVLARCVRTKNGCLVWTGGLDKDGYGKTSYRGKHVRAHRLVYELTVGPIPPGHDLDHVRARGCTSRACCEATHLQPVTPRVNWERGEAPSRIKAGMVHCERGHDITDPANLYPTRNGHRRCRPCNLAWQAARQKSLTADERERRNEKRRARYAARKASS